LRRDGHRWPTLGEQYQTREVLAEGLVANGYAEHPATYFARYGLGPEKWKSLMVDQDKQRAEVAIGLAGSSSCRMSEAISDVNPRGYAEAVDGRRIPLGSATRFSDSALKPERSRWRCPPCNRSTIAYTGSGSRVAHLFDEPWLNTFQSLQERGLLVMDQNAQHIELAPNGKTLVEAIINTEL
jgi:hypothetical protein